MTCCLQISLLGSARYSIVERPHFVLRSLLFICLGPWLSVVTAAPQTLHNGLDLIPAAHVCHTRMQERLQPVCAFVLPGLQLHLSSLRRRAPETLAKGPEFEGNVIVHPTARIGKDCKIGPNVSIGIGCEIDNGVRIANAVLLHRVKVPLAAAARILSSIASPLLISWQISRDTFAPCWTGRLVSSVPAAHARYCPTCAVYR